MNETTQPTGVDVDVDGITKTYPKTLIKVKKLGTVAIDKASGREVTLTNMNIDSGDGVQYFAQPRGLNSDGAPLRAIMVTASRIPDAEEEEIFAPLNIIGSQVTDKASGYTGTATGLFYHQDGCCHVIVQASGTNSKGELQSAEEFNILRLEGEEIEPLDEETAEEVRQNRPSPSGVSAPTW